MMHEKALPTRTSKVGWIGDVALLMLLITCMLAGHAGILQLSLSSVATGSGSRKTTGLGWTGPMEALGQNSAKILPCPLDSKQAWTLHRLGAAARTSETALFVGPARQCHINVALHMPDGLVCPV